MLQILWQQARPFAIGFATELGSTLGSLGLWREEYLGFVGV